jgi:hypothetical protein
MRLAAAIATSATRRAARKSLCVGISVEVGRSRRKFVSEQAAVAAWASTAACDFWLG